MTPRRGVARPGTPGPAAARPAPSVPGPGAARPEDSATGPGASRSKASPRRSASRTTRSATS
ncbi:hypothetical protein NGM37_32030, partial [Streptomyces sp. TRM76130]|nr:hypothetical protein [Streptomyces sp. TRM76130]